MRWEAQNVVRQNASVGGEPRTDRLAEPRSLQNICLQGGASQTDPGEAKPIALTMNPAGIIFSYTALPIPGPFAIVS